MKTQTSRGAFALCIRNDGSEDLEPRKVYQVLPDRAASREGYVRVVDESGEDYLYPADYFVPVRLPSAIAKQFVPANIALPPPAGARHRLRRRRLRAARG